MKTDSKQFSKTHIVHGLANILSGISEFIPLLGPGFIIMILSKTKSIEKDKNHADFIDYESRGIHYGYLKVSENGYNDNEIIKEYMPDEYERIRNVSYLSIDPRNKFFPYYTVKEIQDFIKEMPIFNDEIEESREYYYWKKHYGKKIDKGTND